MIKTNYSAEQLVSRWEDRREIKNLMGKYAYCILLKKESEIFDMLWSQEQPDICLGFNKGYYTGKAAVARYYESIHKNNLLKASVLKKVFPEQLGGKTDEELYGIGDFEYVPLSTPVIELAEDGKTAKGIWYSQGTYADVGTSGPVSYWTWRCYAIDFIKEDGEWRIWHLLSVEDINHPAGQNWTKEPEPYPELPEFAELSAVFIPEPTVPEAVRELYYPGRPFAKQPKLPEPYETFGDTFSYGI